MILLAAIISATVSISPGCKKNTSSEPPLATGSRGVLPPGTEPVSHYSNLFLQDTAFAVLIDKFGNNAYGMAGAVFTRGGQKAVNDYNKVIHQHSSYNEVGQFYVQHALNKEAMLNAHAEILASLLYVYRQHPAFYALDVGQQQAVVSNVLAALKDPAFRNANAGSPVVKAYNKLRDRVHTASGAGGKLTMDEVNDCLKGAVIGAIAGLLKNVEILYKVISGYNLGWSGIVNVAKSALQSALGSTAVGTLVSFGLCIAWDFIDDYIPADDYFFL